MFMTPSPGTNGHTFLDPLPSNVTYFIFEFLSRKYWRTHMKSWVLLRSNLVIREHVLNFFYRDCTFNCSPKSLIAVIFSYFSIPDPGLCCSGSYALNDAPPALRSVMLEGISPASLRSFKTFLFLCLPR